MSKTLAAGFISLVVLTACGGAGTTYSYEEVQTIDENYPYDPYSYGILEGIVVINESPTPIVEVILDGYYYMNVFVTPDTPLAVDTEIIPERLYDVILKFADGNISVVHFYPEWSGVFLVLVPWNIPDVPDVPKEDKKEGKE